MKHKRQAYEGKPDAELREWSGQMALLMLKARADNAKAGVKIDHYRFMRRLL